MLYCMFHRMREARMPPAVLLHFHPDWPFQDSTVIEAMAAAGRYRSQFETASSNGGLTAYPGGERWLWESRLFDKKYDERSPSARPVYGAVDQGQARGAAPRFGSAFLRLKANVTERTTFCYPDSVFEPEGVRDAKGLRELIERMRSDDTDLLDRYVEAHVHGGVRFDTDADAVVLDHCFRGTAIEVAAARLGCKVEFHWGFRVDTETLSPSYRGAAPVRLARSLAPELTPDIVGSAARSGRHDPQLLKKVWHLLARYGGAADAGGTRGPDSTERRGAKSDRHPR